ncbi:MAG TPA: protein-glutamate O-methyltransferase CheR [Polyangiaceae bacterium]
MRSLPAPLTGNSIRTQLSESEWQDLRTVIRQDAGIKLSEAKRVFLVSRLLKRLRATGTKTFREYFRIVTQQGGASNEHQQLINAVTTNKTDFFREPEHFVVLADWLKSSIAQAAKTRGVRIWCAASSTGEEPYTIAAVLRNNLSAHEWARASVLASDIDTAVLATAHRGVYQSDAVQAIDRMWKTKMFVQGTGERHNEYRVCRDLREHVTFMQVNLNHSMWNVGSAFDIVFCRNVLIYFDRPMQERVVTRLLEKVNPEGLLFLGHSESINGMAVSAQAVAHAAYRHRDGTYRAPRGVKESHSVGAMRIPAIIPPASRPQHGLTGRMLRDIAKPLELQLDCAALVFIYNGDAGINFVAVVGLPDSPDAAVESILQSASIGIGQLRGESHSQRRLKAKIVIASGPLVFEEPVEQRFGAALHRKGVELAAFRHQPEALTAAVIPDTTRIRLRQTGPGIAGPGDAATLTNGSKGTGRDNS